ncbi:ATP-binding protein [Qaidamihabitans albus]|uniref:ATP-binding protein n=1 Tax=Qaidamihabitans albus TaxID=2795733 RepID=UPI0018F20CA6|nr:ATP-binding protein [Qaidamihabitans albus]
MRRPELADWIGPRFAGPVELRVPADNGQLAMVRMVVQHVAERADFTPDAVADVKLAVDEACTCLISRSLPGSVLGCRFLAGPDALRVTVSCTTRGGRMPDERTFGWQVMRTVTDSLSAWREEHNGHHNGGRVVHIVIAKRRLAGVS